VEEDIAEMEKTPEITAYNQSRERNVDIVKKGFKSGLTLLVLGFTSWVFSGMISVKYEYNLRDLKLKHLNR